MSPKTIEQRVIKCVAETLGLKPAEVKPSDELFNNLGADSLDALEIVIALENEFVCELDDSLARTITTVQGLIDHIRSLHADETEGAA